MGLVGYELEAKLGLYENQILSAKRTQYIPMLRSLQIDAGRQGFALTARKAAELLRAI